MATKTYAWNINVDDNSYKIEFNKNTISINGGEAQKLKAFRNQSRYPHMEYYIPVGSKEVVLNLPQGREPVLTMDGRDCITGEPFELMELPKWAWIFVILHLVNFFLIIGGAIGGACLGGLSVATTMVASNNTMSTGKRVGICTAIWLVGSLLELVLVIVLAVILSGL